MLVVTRAIPAPVVEGPRAREDARQRVVVGREDRIELVVVAPGAGDGQPEKRLGRRVDLLVHDIVFLLDRIALRQRHRPQREETGRDDSAEIDRGAGGRRQQVSGDLLADELVIRQVFVEGVDDVVPVAPRVAEGMIFVDSGGIGEAGDIEPMAPPLLAVMRRSQKALDQRRERCRAIVSQDSLDFGFARRQPEQIELGAPQQGQAVRRGWRLEPVLPQLGEDETIDVVAHPVRRARIRRRRIRDWLESPVVALDTLGFRDSPLLANWFVVGPGRAHPHPIDQRFDRFGRQLRAGRHLDRAFVADGADQGARLVAADDSRADHRFRFAQVDPGRLQLLAVALRAVLVQQRPNPGFEILVSRRRAQRDAGQRERQDGEVSAHGRRPPNCLVVPEVHRPRNGRTGEERVAAFRHSPIKVRSLARPVASILEQLDEQVGIAERPAHLQPSRSRLT